MGWLLWFGAGTTAGHLLPALLFMVVWPGMPYLLGPLYATWVHLASLLILLFCITGLVALQVTSSEAFAAAAEQQGEASGSPAKPPAFLLRLLALSTTFALLLICFAQAEPQSLFAAYCAALQDRVPMLLKGSDTVVLKLARRRFAGLPLDWEGCAEALRRPPAEN